MGTKIKIALALLFFCNLALASDAPKEEKNEEKKDEHAGYELIRVQQSLRSTLIPKVLSEEMEAAFRKENPEKDTIPRSFLKVETFFEKNAGDVLEKNYEIISPMGGGTVDMSEFLEDGIGSFTLKIKVSDEKGAPAENLKVYSISQAKSRQIGGEKWGDGCFKVYDITSRFQKDMKNGWVLYTKDQRYLSVLAGTLLFVSQDRKGIALAGMTFLDNRFKQLTCFPQPKSE